jgi:hypothetical protein
VNEKAVALFGAVGPKYKPAVVISTNHAVIGSFYNILPN